MKRRWKVGLITAVAVFATACLAGCVPTDKKYFETVAGYSFWDNRGDQSIAQYKFYNIMDEFLAGGTIADGQSVGSDGKVRKVLFVGWDGTRADALANIFYDENDLATNNYNYRVDDFSGLQRLKAQGGLYLAYAGGEKGTESEQSASTSAGWTSELTGGWNTLHGIKENGDVKRADADTIMLKYAKLGLSTGLAFDWGQYFDTNLREEVEYTLDNPGTPMRLRDTDRKIAATNADILKNEGLKKESEIRAPNLDYYNAVAMDGEIHPNARYDISVRDYLAERIAAGDDFVGGIFHRPDTNGHTTGFTNENPHYVNAVRNADVYLYQLLSIVEERCANENEDWLVLTTADHGGSGTDHGKQVYEHRTIFLACNKVVDPSLFGAGYDGFKEKGV